MTSRRDFRIIGPITTRDNNQGGLTLSLKKKIEKPKALSPELIRKIRSRDKNISVDDLIRFHLYVGKTHREIAELLVRGVSFKTLKEEYEKVGLLLRLTFEEYRAIWQGYSRSD
ncbi:MAG: hypothetical protein HY204_08595 [Nitrospirae bacterium]|nr:hypothetical protein [Nitrospirota bacterium]